MSTVRVDTVVLATKEAQMRGLVTNITVATWQAFNAGPVDECYSELHERWSKAQEKLSTGLKEIADVLQKVREAFESVDDGYAAALNGEVGSAP